jgi:hypothetical protein
MSRISLTPLPSPLLEALQARFARVLGDGLDPLTVQAHQPQVLESMAAFERSLARWDTVSRALKESSSRSPRTGRKHQGVASARHRPPPTITAHAISSTERGAGLVRASVPVHAVARAAAAASRWCRAWPAPPRHPH